MAVQICEMSKRGTKKSEGQRLPFGGKRRLYNVIHVRLPNNLKAHRCDSGNLLLGAGTQVIVKTKRGPMLGTTVGQRERSLLQTGSIPPIVRVATRRDIEHDQENKAFEKEALKSAKQHARELGLDMKCLTTQVLHDRRRVIVYFSADERIDFRELVRQLARAFKTRVEMFQIGVRNGAGIIGGLGTCGRELCCSRHLSNFAPISIKMVKSQGLTLNPKKVSGMCGRLMCCLAHEHETYKELKRGLPKRKSTVHTLRGPATVLDVNILQQSLYLRFEDGSMDSLPASKTSRSPLSEEEIQAQKAEADKHKEAHTQAPKIRSRSHSKEAKKEGTASAGDKNRRRAPKKTTGQNKDDKRRDNKRKESRQAGSKGQRPRPGASKDDKAPSSQKPKAEESGEAQTEAPRRRRRRRRRPRKKAEEGASKS